MTIDDPMNPHNNVGKSSFKFYEIKVTAKCLKVPCRWLLTTPRKSSSSAASVIATTLRVGSNSLSKSRQLLLKSIDVTVSSPASFMPSRSSNRTLGPSFRWDEPFKLIMTYLTHLL